MKRLDLEVIGGFFWAAVGIFFALGAVKLKLGTFRNPGPGFIPLGMALLLLFFSLFTVAQGLVKPTGRAREIPWKRPAVVIGAVFLCGSLLSIIGFLPATFILMVILLGLLMRTGKRRSLYVLLFSAVTALGAWLVFSVFLRVPFP